MTDLTTLSKHKHIYRIYEDSAGNIHCTKHPIIYLNSKVVYFKGARKQECLSVVYMHKIYDDFEAFSKKVGTDVSWRKVDDYFWDLDGNLQDMFNEFKHRRTMEKFIRAEKQITDRYLKAQKELEAAKAELMKLASAKETNNA